MVCARARQNQSEAPHKEEVLGRGKRREVVASADVKIFAMIHTKMCASKQNNHFVGLLHEFMPVRIAPDGAVKSSRPSKLLR